MRKLRIREFWDLFRVPQLEVSPISYPFALGKAATAMLEGGVDVRK